MEQTPQGGAHASSRTVEPPTNPESYPSTGYAWFVVGLLTVAYVFSFIDRQILSLMVAPIRHDLGISDFQMSLLMGASFAVFYSLFGIPLGWLADTKSRRLLIAAGVALWSVLTAGCGLTRKFWQLALMRMGVGVGEATLSPAAYSLISDYFRPELRSTAISVYSMGIYLGAGLSFIVGGVVIKLTSGQEDFVIPLLGAVRAWQLVFFLVGLPGLLVAALMLVIREPARKGLHRAKGGDDGTPTTSSAMLWSYFRDNRMTLGCLDVGAALVALNGYGAYAWIPTFLGRRFAWSPGQTGVVFGSIVAVAGTLGIVAGGRLADSLRMRGRDDANLLVALLAAVAGIPFVVAFPLAPTATWSLVFLTPVVFFASMPFGVAPAAIQQMMPNRMRSQASALYLFVVSLIGMGIGPSLVAALTDHIFGKENIGYSLLCVGVCSYVGAGILLYLGLKPYRRSLEYVKEWSLSHA
jgi:MFS family permease